jgi:hypothetical protein
VGEGKFPEKKGVRRILGLVEGSSKRRSLAESCQVGRGMLRPYKPAAIHSLHLRPKASFVAQFYVRAEGEILHMRAQICTELQREFD